MRPLRLAVYSLAMFAPVGVVVGCGRSAAQPGNFADGGGRWDGGAGDAAWNGDSAVITPVHYDAGSPKCVNLQCDQASCGTDAGTTVSGTVYAPNGTLPLYNVIVYVPNAPLEPIDAGISCDQCGSVTSGAPITTALSDSTGHFVLNNVPSGSNIPLVVQLGKWRRETTIPTVKSCQDNPLTDPNLTRLPKNQKEGNMPHIALTTGDCDSVGCILPKVGIDPSEFGYQADGTSKAVNVYSSGSDGLPGATAASTLWSNGSLLSTYDMGIFSCECEEAPSTKGTYGGADFKVVTDYLAAGGRIFTTDYQYTWYRYSPDPNLGAASATNLNDTGIGSITGMAPTGDNPITLNTSFPKGLALAQWLATVFPVDAGYPYGQVSCDYVFDNISSLNSKPQTWASSTSTADPAQPPGEIGPRVFTVNTPAGLPTAQQCGKGVHLDVHITEPDPSGDYVGCNGSTCYPSTCAQPLKEDEAMFAFFFFDLASCIQNEGQPPKPPPPTPP